MKIFVPVQVVPDLVEDLVIADDGKHIDAESTHWMISEFDDHAIEQAVLIKEKHGGEITVLAPDIEGVDDTLYSAAAKGVDHIVKVTGDFLGKVNVHSFVRLFVKYVQSQKEPPDIILAGVQAHNSLDGSLGPQIAAYLNLPFVDYIGRTEITDHAVAVRKEYPGGLVSDILVGLPAVLGIQAANTPPRYVPISKIRQAMKSTSINEEQAGELNLKGEVPGERMYKPDLTQRATMIEGDTETVAKALVALFKEMDIL